MMRGGRKGFAPESSVAGKGRIQAWCRGRAPAVVLLAALGMWAGILASACGGGGSSDDGEVSGGIIVFAASSLTDAFKEAGAAFEAANPGSKVTFSFAASSALAVQINEGAPADVFASADLAQMKLTFEKGSTEESIVFVANTPVVVVPKDGTDVATLADLAKPGVRLVLAAPGVPIGRYSREILAKASSASGLGAHFSDKALANLKSDEANVRAVLTKVQLGEADAGIVYRTDVAAAAGDVRVIEIPSEFNVPASYPIARVTSTKNGATADAFIDFILGPEGQAILKKQGFLSP